MTASLERLVAQKKESIEAVMDLLERGAEVVASAVGELLPLCEVSAPLLRLALDNVHSKEVFYVKEQFLTVRRHLDAISTQLHDIDAELQRARLDSHYFEVEENIRSQFRKYVEILEAKPQFREVKTRLFLEHFSRSGGDKNLHTLHDAMMGTSGFCEPVLELVDRYLSHNRRLLEDFCVRVKELFCLGLIALLGHCALTRGLEEEEALVQEWSERMEQLEARMKETIQECVSAFPQQAQHDAERFLQQSEEEELQQVAEQLLQTLQKKFDWVSWSVRVVKCSSSAYRSWRAGEHFHHLQGQGCFQVAPVRQLLLVVSYSCHPRPLPKERIRQLAESVGRRGKPSALVQRLMGDHSELSDQSELGENDKSEHIDQSEQNDQRDQSALFELLRANQSVLSESDHDNQSDQSEQSDHSSRLVVHAVSRHKECAAAWSFSDDCHYWERHKAGALCVHSD